MLCNPNLNFTLLLNVPILPVKKNERLNIFNIKVLKTLTNPPPPCKNSWKMYLK